MIQGGQGKQSSWLWGYKLICICFVHEAGLFPFFWRIFILYSRQSTHWLKLTESVNELLPLPFFECLEFPKRMFLHIILYKIICNYFFLILKPFPLFCNPSFQPQNKTFDVLTYLHKYCFLTSYLPPPSPIFHMSVGQLSEIKDYTRKLVLWRAWFGWTFPVIKKLQIIKFFFCFRVKFPSYHKNGSSIFVLNFPSSFLALKVYYCFFFSFSINILLPIVLSCNFYCKYL